MSVSPTRCFSAQAGLAAGKSIWGVCACRAEARNNPDMAATTKRRILKFIRQESKTAERKERKKQGWQDSVAATKPGHNPKNVSICTGIMHMTDNMHFPRFCIVVCCTETPDFLDVHNDFFQTYRSIKSNYTSTT